MKAREQKTTWFFLTFAMVLLLGCSHGSDSSDDQSSDSSTSQKSSSSVAICPAGDAHATQRLACYQTALQTLGAQGPIQTTAQPTEWDQLPASDFAQAAPEIAGCRSQFPAACL